MNESNNHIASVADFRAAAELDRKIERVVLPKLGKAVLMRRPSPLWFVFRGWLPASLAAKAAGGVGAQGLAPLQTAEDLQRVASWITDLVSEVMISPRVSLTPGPNEISPHLIADEDLNFIVRWAMGEVAPGGDSGRDLAEFRGERKPDDSGASG